ncbi:Complex I-MWFE [Aphelenchoides besseyi]|nr:Complex I-MWFE [Aphelenchoides besseyi]KAI6200038.1 Complex I-MWFE [Aphelenchoides besseyi]
MWYEQIYSGIITATFVGLALYISGPMNKLDTGRWNRRNTATHPKIEMSKRDHRLTGNFYKINGLDSIQDV